MFLSLGMQDRMVHSIRNVEMYSLHIYRRERKFSKYIVNV